MFTLANSCLTTSNLPWFMNWTFQVPMQYCYLWYETLLPPLDTSTVECHFHFGPAVSFFLEQLVIALCASPVARWKPSDLGGLIFQCHIFLNFHTIPGVLVAGILSWFAISSSTIPPFVSYSLWPLCLRWPYKACLVASLSYAGSFDAILIGDLHLKFAY